jgi:hypothetical protein
VIELKAVDFKPEFAGKMNFYLSAVDDLMRKPADNPTIGILICKRKDNFIAEYALRDIHKPPRRKPEVFGICIHFPSSPVPKRILTAPGLPLTP